MPKSSFFSVITELIIGYALPGRPIVATVIAGTAQLGVQSWMFSNIEDICSSDQKDGFPVIFNGTGLIPPATAVNYVPWALVGFILQYPRNGTIGLNTVQSWIGNTIAFTNDDAAGTPNLDLPDKGFFGPEKW
ncbi:hypothetical protein Clacol_003202 [Clathrus columnatus]|uniref:Uncharacterized protein n=1 Tax=Clathrus columnatus TaxID=1419009 RepID=A0AAV5A7K2_9AGAM|nr:hypothetical protein Clacol_003202 [Clathrus columnatus]